MNENLTFITHYNMKSNAWDYYLESGVYSTEV